MIKDLNSLYRKQPALYEKQFSGEGFEWIDYNDYENSTLVYLRKGHKEEDDVVVILNMTPIPRDNFKIGLPRKGNLREVFNSDQKKYNGTGKFKNKELSAKKSPWHFRPYSTEISLPPLGMIALKYEK